MAGLAARAEPVSAFDTVNLLGRHHSSAPRHARSELGVEPHAPPATRLAGLSATPELQHGVTADVGHPTARAAPLPTLEYQVKAAFLLSFVTFTEWPATAFESPSSPVRLCVMGDDPFEGSLVRTVEGETVAGHPLVASSVVRGEDTSHCHVLFVPRSADSRGGAINRGSSDSPVLIVGESDALWRNGAIISFAIDQGRVRFDVDRTAAERSGLRLSSKLLRIARLVR